MVSMRRPLLLGLIACFLLPVSAAEGRVVVVATGDANATMTEVSTNRVSSRIGLGGRTRGVAVAPDGSRAYVAAGNRIVAIDLTSRQQVGAVVLASGITSLAITADGTKLLAGRSAAVDVVDAAALRGIASIRTGAVAGPIAASPDGARAVVALGRSRVGILDLITPRLTARSRVSRPAGVAWRGGTPWVSQQRGRLLALNRISGRVISRISLGRRGVGGGLAISPSGRYAVVGASGRTPVTAIVDFTRGRLSARVRTGRGPGAPAFSPDGSRVYIADRADGTVSVLSGFSFRRLTVQRLGRTKRPLALAVQPGLAVQIGTDANDTLRGTRGDDRLEGRAGDDVLTGFRGNDQLLGGPNNDQLTGGVGNDRLDGEDGDDRLSGQSGNDTLLGNLANDAIFGGTGNDQVDGGEGGDYLDGGDGDDNVLGGPGDDRINESGLGNDEDLDGGEGNDFIFGGRGSDRMFGREGNDELLGGPGSELLDAGPGDDTIDGGTAGDLLYGREGNDNLRGDAGRDQLFGSTGNDTLDGGSGDDRLSGSSGGDEITAGPGEDDVDGGSGVDIIRVADGDRDVVDCGTNRDTVYVEEDAPTRDQLTRCETIIRIPAEPSTDAPPTGNTISGTQGDDVLLGTPGVDTMLANDGNDKLFGQDGDDYVDGENGNDELHGGIGNDLLYGRLGDDMVLGNEGDDYVNGDRGNDTINGGPGNDRIEGGLDNDVIAGDEGDDRISVAARGTDRVACGPGHDIVFTSPEDEIAADCEDVRR
jgi:Ca2+-binding RTX toxin-like protein